MDRNRRLRLLFDAGTVASAVSLLLWYLLIAPVIASGQTTEGRLVAAAAYPLADMGMVFVVAVVLMRGVNSSVRRTMRLLVASTTLWVVGDTVMCYRYIDPNHPVTVGWGSSPAVHLALPALRRDRGTDPGGQRRQRHRQNLARVTPVNRLPYAAIAAAFVVLAVAAAQPSFRLPWLGLVLCMAALTGCVVARQVLAQRESRRMAVTDGLTGLVNRVGLHEGLSLALARGPARARPPPCCWPTWTASRQSTTRSRGG
jgi:diguanylate cyclase